MLVGELKKGETDIKTSCLGLKRTSAGILLGTTNGRVELDWMPAWMHGVIEAKDRAFCSLCEKLNKQKTWDGGYESVNSENHQGVSEEGVNKYKDFISWFKIDKCLPGWI